MRVLRCCSFGVGSPASDCVTAPANWILLIIYQGYPRFDYGGFSFLMVDPWPEYWSENWYDSDDVYIDYDDGYYLYNPHHPQVRLGIYCRDVTAVFASRRVDSSDRRWEV